MNVNEIEKILDPNERIIWQGRPCFRAFVLKAVPAVFFGLFWCTFLVPFYPDSLKTCPWA